MPVKVVALSGEVMVPGVGVGVCVGGLDIGYPCGTKKMALAANKSNIASTNVEIIHGLSLRNSLRACLDSMHFLSFRPYPERVGQVEGEVEKSLL